MEEKVLIIDFGSQYTQLIARRVRELFVYCEIHPYNNLKVDLSSFKAVILSGSPFSVRSEDALHIDLSEIKSKIPLLGVCYGAQYIAHFFGGKVIPSNKREYGRAKLINIDFKSLLFKGVNTGSQVWMSHSDTIEILPTNSKCIASTEDVKNASFSIESENLYGIQFHPEVYHSVDGKKILENFLINIAKVKADVLIHKAIKDNLQCIFVNNGLLRKNEFDNVLDQYKGMGLNVKGVDASDFFISKLKGVDDPELKRKIIGKAFVDVFDKESKLIQGAKWLAQGTIYPDVIESISVKGPSATIKSHHNVGGLPDFMKLSVVEPLKMLFKDEVRRVGRSLGIDSKLLKRHPFPGPGLAIRILGDITHEKVKILQEVDHIFISGLINHNLYDRVWQAGAILLPVKSVGVMGDERTYEQCVALRAVESTDGMTADWVNLPYEFLQEVSNKIINNVKGVNRVVYDISSKPPATIEWE